MSATLASNNRHFASIGKVAAIAGSLEHYLSSIFALLLGKPDQSEAIIIFSYLESFDRRAEVVNALMERRYKQSPATLERWRNLLRMTKQLQRDRNHVLHGVNLTDWEGKTTIASPTFHRFVRLSGLKGKHAKNRDMTTEELTSCVRSGASLLEEAHRFLLHLSGHEHLLNSDQRKQA